MKKDQKKTSVSAADKFVLKDIHMLLMTLVLAGIYYMYSFFSNGFYQHDEVAHYISMVGFWDNPQSILGNWSKTGYKLVYIFPALLGVNAVTIFNCLIAAFTCFICYKIAVVLKSRYSIVAFLLLASQPFWIQLSFRSYADGFSGFILALALLFHYNKKIPLACFLLSFSAIIRQEFYILLVIYGLYLLFNKKIWQSLILAIFPLFYNFWGYLVTNDILYLYTSAVETSQKYADEWPRQGFWHYFLMSITIFGALQVSLFILYFSESILDGIQWIKQKIFKKIKGQVQESQYVTSPVFIFTSTIIYFLIHSVFNSKSLNIGAATGGNLRYMLAISPLIAVLGTISIDKFSYIKEKVKIFIVFFAFAVLVGVFMTYKHNNVIFSDQRDTSPLLFTIIAIIGILFPFKYKQKIIYFFVVSSLSALLLVKPFKIQPEETAIQKTVNWLVENDVAVNKDVHTNHVIFKFYWDKKENKTHKTYGLDSLTINNAKKGSLLIWETHYSYRPKLNKLHVQYDYFSKKPDKFREIKSFTATNSRFQIFVFEKLTE